MLFIDLQKSNRSVILTMIRVGVIIMKQGVHNLRRNWGGLSFQNICRWVDICVDFGWVNSKHPELCQLHFFLQNWAQISVPLKCGSHSSTNDFGVGLIQYAPHDSSRPPSDE